MPEKKPDGRGTAAALSGGAQLVAAVIMGLYAGRWADERLGTSPWLLLLGVFGGIALGLYSLIRETSAGKSGGA